jgi:hypothetical protein
MVNSLWHLRQQSVSSSGIQLLWLYTASRAANAADAAAATGHEGVSSTGV